MTILRITDMGTTVTVVSLHGHEERTIFNGDKMKIAYSTDIRVLEGLTVRDLPADRVACDYEPAAGDGFYVVVADDAEILAEVDMEADVAEERPAPALIDSDRRAKHIAYCINIHEEDTSMPTQWFPTGM